jgi:dTDP-4-amino-4,6-dideoxygalactose transaminase
MSGRSKIFITRPLLPGLNDYKRELEKIWKSQIITNMGQKHNALERSLKMVLKVKNLTLFNSGTTALLSALKGLNLPAGSEVITTPWTFAATPHSISWCGLKPVFCDIEPKTMTIDADKIENLITAKTSAILAVHCYGFPCDFKKIDGIAKRHGLKVIYDAAHCFSTRIEGKGIGNFGDVTMFSFHATKVFNAVEGGCLTYGYDNLIKKFCNMRNFGIQSEELVEEAGINGKMNELQAAFGLLNLKLYKKEQKKRNGIKKFYDKRISEIKGIVIPQMPKFATNSYQYYPILICGGYPLSRDGIYDKLKSAGIMARKYFYPLCCDYQCYKDLPSSKNLPVANALKNKILCLPFYGDLKQGALAKIVKVLKAG